MPKPMFALAGALLATLPMTAAVAQSAPLAVPAPVAAPVNTTTSAAPASQATAKQISADKQNEVVCKRDRETASLVKIRKTCHTRAQWAYINSENQRQGQDFIASNRAQSSGN